MPYRLLTLLIGLLVVLVLALMTALGVAVWGEETWRYFAQIPPW